MKHRQGNNDPIAGTDRAHKAGYKGKPKTGDVSKSGDVSQRRTDGSYLADQSMRMYQSGKAKKKSLWQRLFG